MNRFLPRLFPAFILFFLFLTPGAKGQHIISGTVYDSTKLYVVPGVLVNSTGGGKTVTDSLGAYHITVSENDSISFYYAAKSTQKFPVTAIKDYNNFDISLRVRVFEKYKLLNEVKIYTKNYRQDSAENRLSYSKIFDYQKPGLHSTSSPGTPPGLDLDELINIFRFRKNKQTLAFQKRLMEEEEDKYINYKFNSTLIKRITGLTGDSLNKYKMKYRPTYEFLALATELEFYEYILNTSYAFKKQEGIN